MRASTFDAKPAASSATSSSTPGRAEIAVAAEDVTMAGRAIAIASSTLFWMPRAMRSGATTARAWRR